MSIKEMIKKVTAKDIKAATQVKKQVAAGNTTSHLIMIAFDN